METFENQDTRVLESPYITVDGIPRASSVPERNQLYVGRVFESENAAKDFFQA